MLFRLFLFLSVSAALSTATLADPKIDKDTCAQLKSEQATFAKSGIAADFEKGPEWAKANLSPERLREIEHYILLDEQLKFGCRQATISIDAVRAGEAANEIENPKPEPAATNPEVDNKKSAAPGSTGATPSGGDEKKPTKPVRERRPKVEQPKVNDAYTPPTRKESTLSAPGPKLTDEP